MTAVVCDHAFVFVALGKTNALQHWDRAMRRYPGVFPTVSSGMLSRNKTFRNAKRSLTKRFFANA